MIRTLACLLLTATVCCRAHADSWPMFLGPDGKAVSSETVPTEWSESKNLAWKVDLPGSGSSSPIISGNKVIVTCYVDGDAAIRKLMCFDKTSGDSLWSLDFPIDYREDGYRGYITEHGYASNTPATDGDHIFAFFGKGGVHCVTMEGERIWSFDAGKSSGNREWGSAASVLLYKDTVIINAADESRTIYCLKKSTGEEVWKQQADMLELTYGTPRIVTVPGRDDELVISVPGEIWSMNPKTGKLLWYATSPMTGNVSPSLIVDGQKVYGFGGYRGAGSIAIKVGGKDDVSDTNVLWTNRTSSYVATPLLEDGKFYWIDDRGLAYCTKSDDGEIVYRERVRDLQGQRPVYASPIKIGEFIYIVTRESGTLVIRPSDEFEVIARNKFASDDTDFNASPAVSDGRLYLRSNQSLYCVASP
ncbi:outer membrane protein assembly factor BamB family protein [Roseiconus lacunae]|uniref:outer membrane protein assembly factor BamB family protein n=1 Tax=Roseiconus lacunae TaxID=2605694 RepID=UPI001E2B6D75|nr:PQQ-binding-like beta-propeller repeat protein [Roseiconus lacunae]MCD0459220.1 PQQ-binding-like beta-propeller repeat protein [Roseiconus lacunae]